MGQLYDSLISSFGDDPGNIRFSFLTATAQRTSFKRDKLGRESSGLGPYTAGNANVKYTELTNGSTAMGKKALTLKRGLTGIESVGGQSINFVYDKEIMGGFASHAGISIGDGTSLIDVKQMVHEALPQLGATNTALPNVAEAMGFGTLEAGPAQLEAIVGQVREKKGERWFARFLAKSGVQDLPGIEYGLQNINDRHNIDRYMGGLNNLDYIPKGISNSAAGRALHVSGHTQSSTMLREINRVFGREYAEIFSSFAGDILNKAGNPAHIAFLLTGENRLLMGVAGQPKTYEALPTFRSGGLGQQGYSHFTTRPVSSNGQAINPIAQWYKNFFKGFAEHGTGGTHAGASIAKGARNARQGKIAFDKGFKGVSTKMGGFKYAASNQGEYSFFAGIFDQHTLMVAPDGNSPFDKHLRHLYTEVVPSAKDMSRGYDGLRTANEATLKNYGSNGGDISMYPAVGPKHSGILAKSSMVGYFLPGTFTTRDYEKGRYQVRGRKEIYRPDQLAHLRGSRRAIGLNRVSPMGMMPGDVLANQLLGQHYSTLRGTGTQAITQFQGTMAVYRGSNSAINEVISDSAAIRGRTGAFSRQRAALGIEKELNKQQAMRVMELLSGGQTKGGWGEAARRINKGTEYYNLGGGLPISQSGLRELSSQFGIDLSEDAKFLSRAKYSDETGTIKMGFMTEFGEAGSDAILIGDTRIDARVIGKARGNKIFGNMLDIADTVTSIDNFSSMDIAKTHYTHRLGLLSTNIGQAGGGADRFLSRYSHHGGRGLEKISNNTLDNGAISWSSGWEYQNFRRASYLALTDMNMSRGLIMGEAIDVAAALGHSLLLGSMAKLGRDPKLYIVPYALRAAENSGVLNQSNAFATKLETMNVIAQSMVTRFNKYGVKHHGMHPGYAQMVKDFEDSTGTVISRHARAPGVVGKGFVESLPARITNFYAPFRANFSDAISAHKYNGFDVLTRKQAYEKFVAGDNGLTTKKLNRGGWSRAQIRRAQIMQEGKEGFFLDLEQPHEVYDSYDMDGSPTKNARKLKTQHVFISTGKELRRLQGPGRANRESLLYNAIGLLEDYTSMPSDTVSGSTALEGRLNPYEHLRVLHTMLAGMGKKNSSISGMLTSRARGGVNARLINRVTEPSKALAMTRAALGNGKNAAGGMTDVFNISISEHTLQHIADNRGGNFTRMKQMAEAGMLFGQVKPRPVHGSAHLTMVRVHLSSSLSNPAFTLQGQHHVSMNPLLASMLDRDFDKDDIELQVLEDWTDGKNTVMTPRAVIQAQKEIGKGEYIRHIASLEAGSKAKDAVLNRNIDSLKKHSLAYFGFGTAPPLSFVRHYSTLAFGSLLTEQGADGMVSAEASSRLLSTIPGAKQEHAMTARDINTYRDLLGENPRQVYEEAMMLNRNVLQAPISKGGASLESLMGDFLHIPNTVQEMMHGPKNYSHEEIITESVRMAKEFITNLYKSKGLAIDFGRLSDITDPAELIDEVSDTMGRMSGVAAIASSEHYGASGMATPNLIHNATNSYNGSISGGVRWMFDESTASVMGDYPDEATLGSMQQDALAELNEATGSKEVIGSSSRVLEGATSFLKTHAKTIAAIGAGLLALKTISSVLTDTPNDVAPAPLPKNPMVGMQHAEFNPMALDAPTAYMRTMSQGHSAQSTSYGSSQQIGNMVSALAINSSAHQGSFSNINITDSRSFSNGYQVQRQAMLKDVSDFTTEDSYYA